jgi:hypothetical protein
MNQLLPIHDAEEASMRVTFDTNTLADVVSPETSQRPNGASAGAKVRAAVQAGTVQGFFCETMITLEGIKNVDRSAVFGSTTANTNFQHGVAPDGNGVTYINMRAEQTARQPLDRRQADRFLAAFTLGMKLLGAPRIGMVRVDDPDGNRYVAEPAEGQIGRRLERHVNVVTAIEARGLGCAQARMIAAEIKAEVGGYGSFISYLGKPRTPAEQGKINRAVAEWADGDSIAAHYGYNNDLFCTEDFGKGGSTASALDDANRKWLSETFAIQFVTLAELAAMV